MLLFVVIAIKISVLIKINLKLAFDWSIWLPDFHPKFKFVYQLLSSCVTLERVASISKFLFFIVRAIGDFFPNELS